MSSLKGLGRNEQWSRYGTGGGYTDTITVGPYKIEIEDTSTDTRFFLWNPVRPCVNMVFDKRERVGVIDSIKYDPDCTSPEKMKRGSGTREMVEFSIDVLKRSGATIVYLTDKSTIDCKGVEIELGPMYFLKYGKTWYENYFDFKPSAKFAASYDRAKKNRTKMLDTDALAKQDCSVFDSDTVNEFFRHIGFVNFHSVAWEKQL